MAITTTPTTISGVIERVFVAAPSFSAGTLRTEDGGTIRFRGSFCANFTDWVSLSGKWIDDPTYGEQLHVESVSYDLPQSQAGLIAYLAANKKFKGIGKRTAQKIVAHAGSTDALEEMLKGDLKALRVAVNVPLKALTTLRDAWLANQSENRLRTFLARYELTPHQMDALIESHGEKVVGILKADPYWLIGTIPGFAFKRVDQIAQAVGATKDHPGRVKAALLHALKEAVNWGHTWTEGDELVSLALKLLELPATEGEHLVRKCANDLLSEGRLANEGKAITLPWVLEAETVIRDALSGHAFEERTTIPSAGHEKDLIGGQLDAYAIALKHPISVISGGAGTGKTYVVSRLAATFKAAGLKVALCAPTGKAAKRIEEVLGKAGLDLKASTIHRLLHYDGKEFQRPSLSEDYEFYDQEGEAMVAPALDVVIVDEVSMVDVPLMAELMERIEFNKTRLVLVGDHNQLPPVGPGNVLRDILQHRLAPAAVLTEVVRQAGPLKANSTRILSGEIRPTENQTMDWVVIDRYSEPEAIREYLRELVSKRIPEKLNYDPLKDVQILTPIHKGPLGTMALNETLQELFHGETKRRFVVGDKVIQTVNDYDLEIMNGTIGIVRSINAEGIIVDFDGSPSTYLDGERLENIQLAYALTAHKAQGSEWPCAVVVCHSSHYFAHRNWLYTAVTRAAKTCFLVGDKYGLQRAAKKNEVHKRRTFLGRWAEKQIQQAAP